MKISIQAFLPANIGYSQTYSMEDKVRFDEFKLAEPIKLRVKLMRLEDGIHVYIEDIETVAHSFCDKCLKEFIHPIAISSAERIYYLEKPPSYDQEADQADIFMVDMKHHEIDLTELLRQEILLHFPTSRVCSKSCKGVNSPYKVEEPNTYKPFTNLKDLLNGG